MVLEKITRFTEDALGLKLNRKTQVFPLKNGIEYLGFRFYVSDTGKVIRRMKRASKQRFKKRILKIEKDYACGKIDATKVRQSLAGFNGHLKHGHTYHLQSETLRKIGFQIKQNKKEEKQ